MKKILIFILVLCIISMVLMVFNFLASTDIYHDYIGTGIRSAGIVDNAENLPVWTACKLEWMLLKIDYYTRVIFMVLITIVMVKLIQREK
jgi:hypothetical protein